MARRVLPAIDAVTIAAEPRSVAIAGGLTVLGPARGPAIMCGGTGGVAAAEDPSLRRRPAASIASVCTGALVLAATGVLDGRAATTCRRAVGGEVWSPLALLPGPGTGITPREALIVDAGVVNEAMSRSPSTRSLSDRPDLRRNRER